VEAATHSTRIGAELLGHRNEIRGTLGAEGVGLHQSAATLSSSGVRPERLRDIPDPTMTGGVHRLTG